VLSKFKKQGGEVKKKQKGKARPRLTSHLLSGVSTGLLKETKRGRGSGASLYRRRMREPKRRKKVGKREPGAAGGSSSIVLAGRVATARKKGRRGGREKDGPAGV